MTKKFWQRGPVSQMLKKPKKALKKTFQAVRGRKGEWETLIEALPGYLPKLERGLEPLDRDFPIREGQSRIDFLALNAGGELVFIWVKRHCNAETLSKLLPDYDWIQKNQALWPHLFPKILEHRSLSMKVWIFALEIDPEVKFLLNYLNGIRVQLYFCRSGGGAAWAFTPWAEFQKGIEKIPSLPSSPTLLPAAATPKPGAPEPAHSLESALISRAEIEDLISLVPNSDAWQEDEETDPGFASQILP